MRKVVVLTLCLFVVQTFATTTHTSGRGSSSPPGNVEGRFLGHLYNACGIGRPGSEPVFGEAPRPTAPPPREGYSGQYCAAKYKHEIHTMESSPQICKAIGSQGEELGSEFGENHSLATEKLELSMCLRGYLYPDDFSEDCVMAQTIHVPVK